MTKQNILILAGSPSLEHEISIITAMQVLENIDQSLFNPMFVLITKDLQFELLEGLISKNSYFKSKRIPLMFGNDNRPFIAINKTFGISKTYIDAAILTTHGGLGEGGQLQGMLDMFKIPFYSCRSESAAISLNKSITKSILAQKIPLIPFITYYLSSELPKPSFAEITQQLGNKIILKPSKLGSSIGIKIIDNELDFEKAVLEISQYEDSVLVESFLDSIQEFNCAIKRVGGRFVLSEIEEPMKTEDILSFDDKYQKGSKKGGQKVANNIFNSQCPANISVELSTKIKDLTKLIYVYLGCEGVVRIDYIYHDENLYFSEINTIPGSLSKHLFEATGVSFEEQITEMVTQASILELDNYKWFDKSDLVKKYIQ